jgi:hypothetical protein
MKKNQEISSETTVNESFMTNFITRARPAVSG